MIHWLVQTNRKLESSPASCLARELSRGHVGCNHHPRLSWCAPHRAGQWAEEIHLVLWFHPLLHNPWRWSTQSAHPASDTWRQWVQTNTPISFLWIIMSGNTPVFASLFMYFAYAFHSTSLLSFFFHYLKQFYRGWQSLTGNMQSSVVYLQTGQDSVQFSTKSEMEEAKNARGWYCNQRETSRAEQKSGQYDRTSCRTVAPWVWS